MAEKAGREGARRTGHGNGQIVQLDSEDSARPCHALRCGNPNLNSADCVNVEFLLVNVFADLSFVVKEYLR